MELIHCALLLNKAGKEINEHNVKKVLEAAGIKEDEGKVKALVAALEGVNIEEVVKEASMMQVHAVQAPVKEEAKKEDKKEEKKNDEAASAGLGALFG